MIQTMNCYNCKFLNKSKKLYNEDLSCFRYGCDYKSSGYVPFWVFSTESKSAIDSELKNSGCSSFQLKNDNEQLRLF